MESKPFRELWHDANIVKSSDAMFADPLADSLLREILPKFSNSRFVVYLGRSKQMVVAKSAAVSYIYYVVHLASVQ